MPERVYEERSFQSFDGAELFYRAWLPSEKRTGALILLHRGHEHSARFVKYVEALALESFAIFAWDARGHGLSPGERGYARHFSDYARDLDAFTRHLSSEFNFTLDDCTVIAHSVAAIVAAQWVHDYAPPLRGLVLATPAFEVKLYVPAALLALRVDRFLARRFGWKQRFIKSYVKGRLLTHDPQEAAEYDSDPIISKQIAANVLIDLFDIAKRLRQDAGAFHVPLLLLSARVDWVVKNKPQREFFDRISSRVKIVKVLPRFYHAIFHEVGKEQVVDSVREFVLERYARPREKDDFSQADSRGFTAEEYQWLAAGLPPISFKRLSFALQRRVMQTLGKWSEGIRIGWTEGFDSGASLDHVYKNVPQGKNVLGRMFDREYLRAIGWRGIRQRKLHIEHFLEEIVQQNSQVNSTQRIVDFAGGPARYLIDFAARHQAIDLDILVRDTDETGLDRGRTEAQLRGIQGIRFERGDAFDLSSLAELPASIDIAIVSGLYELFPSNEPVLNSLKGIARAVRSGGRLLYTNQPWHPQLEMIAQVLLNREGKPWVMRRRIQAEMDALVESVGFRKIQTLVDDDGIFTVSLAERR